MLLFFIGFWIFFAFVCGFLCALLICFCFTEFFRFQCVAQIIFACGAGDIYRVAFTWSFQDVVVDS